MAITEPVVIAGAGPVGCTAALRLAQAGIPVILLEALDDLPETLRASTFHPPSMDMLDELGMAKPLIEQGLICQKYQYRDRRTGEIAEFDLSVLEGDTRHPYRLQAEQWKYTRLVWNELQAKYSNVATCLFNHAIKGVWQTADGLEILVSDHGEEKVLRGSFLIGADGADSAVRKAAAIRFEGFTYPEKFLVASTPFPLEEKFERLALVNYVSDPEEWLVLLRTPTLWRVLIPTDPAIENDALWLSDQWIQDRLHHMAPHDEDYEIIHRSIYRVHQRVAVTYRRGRVLLAGDSAHINNPLGGMGMNGGIHDAWNLCDKLIQIHAGEPMDPLLDLYDRQRRGICVRFVQEHTKNNKALMESKDPEVQRKRQADFMRAANDHGLARAFLLKTSMIQSLREAALIV
ncbi:MAG: FAD-dependent oxidoreductase [Steroidobacteraceae bacterium]|nr:FAD-dependent monooxygenase [Gammaproteobacteria bacterium]